MAAAWMRGRWPRLARTETDPNAMAMSNLSTRIGVEAVFGTNICLRRARGPRILRGMCLLLGLLVVGSGCEAGQNPPSGSHAVTAEDASPASMKQEESRMWMTVGERRFAITLTDNAAARAFAAQLPLTLDMSELNGNEKHADLPKPLPANASRPGTIRNGDLMLYGADTLVVFYLTFQSSYSYTRLGRVDDPPTCHRRSGRAVFESYFPRTS
jgi:hypothetical protein